MRSQYQLLKKCYINQPFIPFMPFIPFVTLEMFFDHCLIASLLGGFCFLCDLSFISYFCFIQRLTQVIIILMRRIVLMSNFGRCLFITIIFVLMPAFHAWKDVMVLHERLPSIFQTSSEILSSGLTWHILLTILASFLSNHIFFKCSTFISKLSFPYSIMLYTHVEFNVFCS